MSFCVATSRRHVYQVYYTNKSSYQKIKSLYSGLIHKIIAYMLMYVLIKLSQSRDLKRRENF